MPPYVLKPSNRIPYTRNASYSVRSRTAMKPPMLTRPSFLALIHMPSAWDISLEQDTLRPASRGTPASAAG